MIKTVVSVKRTAGMPLNASLKELKKTSIYVGIPRGSDGDARSDGGPPNSDLGWIHEKVLRPQEFRRVLFGAGGRVRERQACGPYGSSDYGCA